MNHKCCVVTVASRPKRGYWLFLESCHRNGIEPIVLGEGDLYENNVDKLPYLNEFLNTRNNDFTHVLYCDAFDVVFAAGANHVLNEFLCLDAPLVFSAEKTCWPDPELADRYPEAPTALRFLNAGLWIGEIETARQMMDTILTKYSHLESESDQRLYTHAFLNGDAPIALDHQARFFHSLYDALDDLEWENKEKRIRNRLTGCFPSVFHGNATSNMYFVVSCLGLIPSFEESFEKAAEEGQMARNQYRHVSDLIQSRGIREALVIGAGHDALLWYHCCKGNVQYVENDPEWFPRLPCVTTYHDYQGRVGIWLDEITIPLNVDRPWDLVLVDGPAGYTPDSTGRQESICWASQLATKCVVVHDYERDWDRRLCDHYLGEPTEIVRFNKENDRLLAVFDRSEH